MTFFLQPCRDISLLRLNVFIFTFVYQQALSKERHPDAEYRIHLL